MGADTQKTLNPIDDVYIYKGTAGTGNEVTGMDQVLRTYFSATADNNVYNRVSFLKFDMSSLGSSILSAKFRLYGDVKYTHTMEVYEVSGTTWAEDALTFNNFTAQIGTRTLMDTLRIENERAKYYEWNLSNAVKAAKQAGKRYFAIMLKDKYSVKDGGNAGVVVDWHSKENESGNKPQLVVTEKDNSLLELGGITVGGVALPGFNAKQYSYEYSLPASTTTIPAVVGTPLTVGAQVNVVAATNLNGTTEQRTTKININYSGETLTYSILFKFLPPDNEAFLDSILVNGEPLSTFAYQTLNYRYNLPYTSTVTPVVAAQGQHPQSLVNITQVANLQGNINERTAKIEVQSPDRSTTLEYKVEFVVLPKLDLYLFIGQSNMAGRGTMSAADKTEVITNTLLFDDKNGWEEATNPLNKYSNIRKDISQQQICPAYGFSKKVVAETGLQIGIVVNALGGSNINQWVKGAELYEKTMLRAKEAQKWGEYKAILWHQGESNSNDAAVAAYPGQLTNMVNGLRTDLGCDTLYFVAGELAYWRGGGTGSTAFNNMIRGISGIVTHSDWVSADGLTPLIDASDPHFDAASQKTLGARYADKVLSKIYPNRAPLSSEKSLLSFSVILNGESYQGEVKGNEIIVALPAGTKPGKFTPVFTASTNAKVLVNGMEQESGVSENNFQSAVTYTVRAEDLTEKTYTVRILAKPSFLTYAIIEPTTLRQYSGVISSNSIAIILPKNTAVSALVPLFTTSDNTKVYINDEEQVSSERVVNFTNSVEYKLLANNVLEDTYVITANVESATAVGRAKTLNAKVYSVGSTIHVEEMEGEAEMSLYNTQGSLVLQAVITPPAVVETLKMGIHIVVLRQNDLFFVKKLLLQPV